MGVVENDNFKEQDLERKGKLSQEEEEEEEEEEALSLCDLPIVGRDNCERYETSSCSNAFEEGDFEFSWVEEDPTAMCAADDVFFQGQILPLRPSVSSESGLLPGFRRPDSQKSSRCGSRSDSMDRSLVFSSSGSSNRSSSRSHSLSSSSSTYNLHSHPTPKPHMGTHPRRNAAKPSRKSSGWGLFRLGLVRTPEIELEDLKSRKRNNISKNESLSSSITSGRRSPGSDSVKKVIEKKESKQEQGLHRFFGGGLSCKCSADAADTVSSRIVILKSRKQVGDEEESLGKQAMSQRRTFEWLRHLSIAETPVA